MINSLSLYDECQISKDNNYDKYYTFLNHKLKPDNEQSFYLLNVTYALPFSSGMGEVTFPNF